MPSFYQAAVYVFTGLLIMLALFAEGWLLLSGLVPQMVEGMAYALVSTASLLMYTPTASTLVADLGPAALRGRYLATYEFSWGLANALTPALFTVLYAVTPALPWIVLALLVALSGMIMFYLERRFPSL